MTGNIDPQLVLLLVGLAAFVTGAVAAWLAARARMRGATQAGRASRDAEVVQLSAEAESLRREVVRLGAENARAQTELDEQHKRLFALGNERATLSGRLERITQLDADLAAARAEAQKWR